MIYYPRKKPMKPLPSSIGRPPRTLRNARLDNIALVPASLLTKKGTYQVIANNLPGRGVLICQTDKKERITQILERVAAFFRQHGHTVKILPASLFL
jgi:hypothetical protein